MADIHADPTPAPEISAAKVSAAEVSAAKVSAAEIPIDVQLLFSTAHLGALPPCENPDELARRWPFNGDRDWAERCLAWLDAFLARQPSPAEARQMVFRGWHGGPLLSQDRAYVRLLQSLRDRIAAERTSWSHHKICDYPFEGGDAPLAQIRRFFDSGAPEDFDPHIIARAAWALRAQPEILDVLIMELQDILACQLDEDALCSLWRKADYVDGNALRVFLGTTLGALETARIAAQDG